MVVFFSAYGSPLIRAAMSPRRDTVPFSTFETKTCADAPFIVDGEIPGTIEEYRIGQGLYPAPVTIDHLQSPLANGGKRAVGSRHIPHEYKPTPQHSERGARGRAACSWQRDGTPRRRQSSVRRQPGTTAVVPVPWTVSLPPSLKLLTRTSPVPRLAPEEILPAQTRRRRG